MEFLDYCLGLKDEYLLREIRSLEDHLAHLNEIVENGYRTKEGYKQNRQFTKIGIRAISNQLRIARNVASGRKLIEVE